jgi:hypothetical protein
VNKYGAHAQKLWQEWAPGSYAGISDPERFFSRLGRQAAQMMAELEPQIAGPDPVGESYREQAARLSAATLRAEHLVRTALLAPPHVQLAAENSNEMNQG